MPVVIYPRLRKAIVALVGVTSVVLFASTGVALAACPAEPVSTPFSQWGDGSDYFLVPGGSFEATADQLGWTLSGASLTTGNEPFNVDGAGDQQSLEIDGGGSATSPYFCVDNSMSNLRFFAQQASAGTDLNVEVLVQTGNGVNAVRIATLADGSLSAWAPTDALGGSAQHLSSDTSLQVALRFEAPASSGSWDIDDIYVDPYRSG